MEIIIGVVAYILIGFGFGCFFKFFDWFFAEWDSQDAAMCVFLWPVFLVFAIAKVITWPVILLFSFIFD